MMCEQWAFINTFAPWVSAVGTLLAVIVSLYISYSTRKISLKIYSDIYEYETDEKYIGIYVVNTGYRTVFLNNTMCISFQVGLLKKTNIGIGWKYIDNAKSSNFPCRLGENETACLFIKMNNEEGNWLENFKKELKEYSLFSLRIIVYPNVGKPFKVKIGKNIESRLKSYKEKTTNKSFQPTANASAEFKR